MAEKPNEPDAIRAKAETQLARTRLTNATDRSTEELLHELQVHQVELEMQNETLRQNQAILEESRDRYVDLYDFAPVAYLTLSREGQITEINLTGASLLGLDRGKLLRQRFSAFVAHEDTDHWHRYFMDVLRHDIKLTCELELRHGDGSVFFAQMNSMRLKVDGKFLVRIALTDISERKRSEQSRLEHVKLEQSLSVMAANIPGFIFTVRVGQDGHTSFPFASAGVEDLFGLTPDEIRDDAAVLRARYHPGDLPRLLALMEETERTLAPFRIEIRIVNRDNRQSWIEIRSMPQRQPDGATEWHGIMLDITERKRMEDIARSSQERLTEAQRIGQMGSWELDLVSGALAWSAEIFRIFEIDPERFGASYEAFLDAIHPDDREAVNLAYTESLTNHVPYEIEHRLLFAGGRIKHVRERCESHYDADGKPVYSIGTVQDITERKQMEEILRSKEEKLSSLFTLSPLGIALTDMQGRYVEFNEAFRKICGYPADELMTLNYWVLTPKEYEAKESEQLAALRKTGRYGSYEKEYRQKSGNLIPIQLNGVLVKGDDNKDYIWSIVEDITVRKRMEAELQHREQMFRDLTENAPDNIIRYDTAGRVVYANPVLERTLGMQASALIGTRPRDRHLDGSFDDFERTLNNVIASGRDDEIEQVLPDGAGGTLIHQVRMVAERNQEGALISVLAIGKDITDLKRYEAAREAALDEAMRLAKLRSEFLTHMSHELRTPLNGILGYAQILQRDRAMGEQNAAALNVIRQSGEHLLALIDDILDMAHIETGRFELVTSDIPLIKFLRVVADIVSVRARQKDIDFSCDLAPDLPAGIRGDERRLRQVLLNLLSNAIKFTDRGGVVLHVSRVTPSRLAFAVQDTGIGIAESELENIFHSFEQSGDAQHRHGGTGLGLAISRQLTRLMGGNIAVESRIGEGSTFRFELELPAVKIAPPSLLPAQVATGYAGPRRKVLVVDDVAENRAVVASLLVPLGFEIVDACDGIEALELAQSTLPDLILMDIVMRGPGRVSGMDGMEATRRLRQLPMLVQMPIVMLSASAVNGDEEKCLELGANAFMVKPFDQNQLLTLIASLLHLEWTVTPPGGSAAAEDESTGKLVAPPAEAMQALHRLALMGNMRDIVDYAKYIDSLDPRYQSFAEHLKLLAEGYQSKAILAFVEEYLHDTSN